MATQDIKFDETRGGIRAALDHFFATVGQGMNAYLERRSRMEQIDALYEKSDEELAALGITRQDIPAYVFRDLFYL